MPLKEYNLKLDINKILNNITNKDNQYTIPIFIPHLGCNNECVFCNQRKITGIDTSVTVDDVDNIINEHLDYFKNILWKYIFQNSTLICAKSQLPFSAESQLLPRHKM